MAVSFILNGEPAVADVDPHVTLLQWLRASGRCGTKEGCAEGECGACAVAVLRRDDRGARFESVNSCLLPVAAVHGLSIVTVEGVAEPEGELHPVQRALMEHGASQCGYCTPGFVISLFCEYYRAGRDGFDPEAISGNLCRCTGYRPIADAARSLSAPDPADRRLPLLREPPAAPGALEHRHGGRRFVRPTSLAGALEALAEPGAVAIAGGTDLMVLANQRDARWPTLISLAAVEELQRVEVTSEAATIGAGVTLAALERADLPLPLLRQLWPLFSSRLIRHQATLGGNLATASPIGDAAPALLALEAELVLASAAGERRVPLHEFFVGYRRTQLGRDELITRIVCPLPAPSLQRLYKVSKRLLDDISTVAAAFALDLDAEGRVTRLRAAFGGIAATPLRAVELEALAAGKPWTEATLELLVARAQELGTPLDDHRGSAAYRRAMLGKLLEKFFFASLPAEAAE